MGNEDKEILLSDEQFLEAIKESGLEKSLNSYTAKIADKRVSEGVETFRKNLGKKDLSDKERLQEVETELKGMKDGKAKEDKKTLVKAELRKQDISEGFLKYIKIDDLDDQSKIAEAVTNFKDDLLNEKQAEIDQKLKEGEIPNKGESTFTGSGSMETVAKDYAKKISVKE